MVDSLETTSRSGIESNVITIVADIACTIPTKVVLETDLKSLDLDSLDLLEIAEDLEFDYNIEITDQAISDWVCVQDIVNTVGDGCE